MVEMRDQTFDLMKCVGIVAVLCGHLVHGAGHYVESFHMPLFFLISGFFYKEREIRESLIKDAKRLLVPYAIVAFIMIGWKLLEDGVSIKSFILLVASYILGFVGDKQFHGMHFTGVLVMWFLMALFLAKNLYNVLQIKYRNKIVLCILCFTLAGIGITLRGIANWPFNICQALTAMPYLFVGNFYGEITQKQSVCVGGGRENFAICSVAIWVIAILFSAEDMSACYYQIYPLDFFAGVLATYVIYLACSRIAKWKNKRIVGAFAFVGGNSLFVMCFHDIEWQIGIWRRINVINAHFVSGVLHVVFVLLLSCVSIWGIKKLKKEDADTNIAHHF